MAKSKIDPVILPDVHDPNVPLSDLIPPMPTDDPATAHQPEPSPDTRVAQPQTDPLEDKDSDISGGD